MSARHVCTTTLSDGCAVISTIDLGDRAGRMRYETLMISVEGITPMGKCETEDEAREHHSKAVEEKKP